VASGATGLSPYCPRTRFSRSQEDSRDGFEDNEACQDWRICEYGAGRHQHHGAVRLALRDGVDVGACRPQADTDGDARRALGAAVTTVVADGLAHLHLHEHADGHADHGDAAADHACPDADADADVGRSGASGGDRLPASDGLTCR
jgi:hypothetical protein